MVGMVAGVKVSCTYRNSMVLLPTFVPPTSTTLKHSSVDMSSSYAPSMLWAAWLSCWLTRAARVLCTYMSVHATSFLRCLLYQAQLPLKQFRGLISPPWTQSTRVNVHQKEPPSSPSSVWSPRLPFSLLGHAVHCVHRVCENEHVISIQQTCYDILAGGLSAQYKEQ